jgi:hypothetical protein
MTSKTVGPGITRRIAEAATNASQGSIAITGSPSTFSSSQRTRRDACPVELLQS